MGWVGISTSPRIVELHTFNRRRDDLYSKAYCSHEQQKSLPIHNENVEDTWKFIPTGFNVETLFGAPRDAPSSSATALVPALIISFPHFHSIANLLPPPAANTLQPPSALCPLIASFCSFLIRLFFRRVGSSCGLLRHIELQSATSTAGSSDSSSLLAHSSGPHSRSLTCLCSSLVLSPWMIEFSSLPRSLLFFVDVCLLSIRFTSCLISL
jgi:hypothetical protein